MRAHCLVQGGILQCILTELSGVHLPVLSDSRSMFYGRILVISLLLGLGFQCTISREQIRFFSLSKMLSFKSSLCIPDTRRLSDIICKCFYHSVICLFDPFLQDFFPHKANISNFDEAQCISFSFYGLCFLS